MYYTDPGFCVLPFILVQFSSYQVIPQNLTVDPSFKNKPRLLTEGCASSRGCSEFASRLAAILPTTATPSAIPLQLVLLFSCVSQTHSLDIKYEECYLPSPGERTTACIICQPFSALEVGGHFIMWKKVSCPYNSLCCYGELLVLLFGALGSLAGLGS